MGESALTDKVYMRNRIGRIVQVPASNSPIPIHCDELLLLPTELHLQDPVFRINVIYFSQIERIIEIQAQRAGNS